MKQRIKRMVICLLAALLCLQSGCKQPALEESSAAEQEKDAVTTLRWAVMGREEKSLVASRRAGKVNQLLQEKGYPLQIELIYIGNSKWGNPLQILKEQETKFDIVTFQMMRCGGAQQMEEELLALEEYMAEGKALEEVYQLFSKEIWEADQIEGHQYNLGRLLHVLSPTYSVAAKKQEEAPAYPEEIFLAGDEEEIGTFMRESDIQGIVSEPYIGDWPDGMYMQHAFHMIAPGVGLNMEGGDVFENVWESEYAKERERIELANLDEKNYVSIMGSNVFAIDKRIQYSVSERLTYMYREVDNGRDTKDMVYWFVCPAADQMRLVPNLEQQYTSVLKNSEHPEESVELLAALNMDPELTIAFCEESEETPYDTLPIFTALCNAPGEEGEERTAQKQNECFEELQDNQKSPILGFTFDRRPVEEEVQKLEELQQSRHMELVMEVTESLEAVVEDEEQLKAATREMWVEKMEDYKQQFKEAGIDRVIEEANRQLAAWRSSQG